jgi:hypothetical protein
VPSRAAGFVLSAGAPQTSEHEHGAGEDLASEDHAPADERPADGPVTDPSFIWDLAATDAFPAAVDHLADPDTPEAPGSVPSDGEPGASDS